MKIRVREKRRLVVFSNQLSHYFFIKIFLTNNFHFVSVLFFFLSKKKKQNKWQQNEIYTMSGMCINWKNPRVMNVYTNFQIHQSNSNSKNGIIHVCFEVIVCEISNSLSTSAASTCTEIHLKWWTIGKILTGILFES